MSLREKKYIDRLVDKKIEKYLSVFGAISIEGPKWCGKTWTSLNHSNSKVLLDEKEMKEKAELSVDLVLNGDSPILIDEWNLVPKLWDAVRRKCDELSTSGNYILTGSTKLSDEEQKEEVHHSGAGIIGRIKMHTMSLYESGDSDGVASITDMLNGTQKDVNSKKYSLEEIANFIIRGGWPRNINNSSDVCGLIPKGYIDAVLDKDINDEKKRDRKKMEMLLKSLSRNESCIVSNNTLLKDIEEYETSEEVIESRNTIAEYLDVLERLNLIENQDAYSENYRSAKRVGKSPKRHLADPSLACACLNLNISKLIGDLNTFGFMFEALVERDLRVYMEYLDGNLYHFRDNVTGLEIDSILEFEDGEYGAIEIKLGYNKVEEAKENLLKFYDNMVKKPKFMCVIVGNFDAVVRDPKTGIYIVPITALKP
jgi:hypothetical protein